MRVSTKFSSSNELEDINEIVLDKKTYLSLYYRIGQRNNTIKLENPFNLLEYVKEKSLPSTTSTVTTTSTTSTTTESTDFETTSSPTTTADKILLVETTQATGNFSKSIKFIMLSIKLRM